MSSTNPQFPSNTRFFTVSTAGHVDHGKTSLIRALTGIDTDRLKEEKERQMTTDLGFAHLTLQDRLIIGFVDVPGHGKFLKNMLAGVGGIDLALLVIAADEGPMPQTRQHVRILSMLGVNKAIVALNKIDVVHDTEHVELIEAEINELLKIHGIALQELVHVSSIKNQGIEELKKALERQLEQLPPRVIDAPAFLPVDRVFSSPGFGTVVTGTLVNGQLKVGDQVSIGPEALAARVRRLECFGQSIESAGPGQRVACNLVLKENKQLSRGQVVLGKDLPATKMIVASVIDRPKLIGEKFAQRISSQPVRVYHGTAEYQGYLRWAEDIELQEGEGGSETGNAALALIALEHPAVIQCQDRFVLRLSDDTIYGGIVLLSDRPRWMKRQELGDVAKSALSGDYTHTVMQFISSTPAGFVRKSQLSLLLPAQSQQAVLKVLIDENKVALLDEAIMTLPTRATLKKRLSETVRTLLKDQANSDTGASVESVRLHLTPKLDRATFQALVDEEVKAKALIRTAEGLKLAGQTADKQIDFESLRLQDEVCKALQSNFCIDLSELARLCRSDANKIKNVVIELSKKAGQVHLINYEFVINDDNLRTAHQVLADLWQVKRNITPTEFKEKLSVSRKYAMALLQHFDDNKVTRRLNEGRVLLKAPPPSRA